MMPYRLVTFPLNILLGILHKELNKVHKLDKLGYECTIHTHINDKSIFGINFRDTLRPVQLIRGTKKFYIPFHISFL